MTSEAGRWYTADGVLVEEASLKEARARLLYPSVTQLQYELSTPYSLQQYMNRQLILAGSTSPWKDGETDETFSARVLEESREHANDAAAVGTRMHAGINKMLRGEDHEGLVPEQVRDWIEDNLDLVPNAATELTVVDQRHGFAGTTDYWGRVGEWGTGIVDFKTQGVKVYKYTEKRTLKSGEVREYERERKTPSWHDKWPRQLAAYATALGDEMFRADRIEELMGDSLPENHRARKFIGREMPGVCVSLVINTNEDHPNYQGPDHPGVWIRKWKREVIDHSQDVMEEVARLFYLINKFPRPGSEKRAKLSSEMVAAA